MLNPTIQGIKATAIIPDRIASGGDPNCIDCQYSGCGINVYSSVNASAANTRKHTPIEGKMIGLSCLCTRRLGMG